LLRSHFPALAALTGEAGARDLLNGDPAQVTAVELPALAHDLDTPADYDAVKSAP
jgi:molybdenum cofactor cytidylyltransferase